MSQNFSNCSDTRNFKHLSWLDLFFDSCAVKLYTTYKTKKCVDFDMENKDLTCKTTDWKDKIKPSTCFVLMIFMFENRYLKGRNNSAVQ